jgi:hypothetical protein
MARRREESVFKIHPAFGVARVGDSADAWFIGPELPGSPPLPFAGLGSEGFREKGIKRQAARFRVYQYDVDERGHLTVSRELTLDEEDVKSIEWTVHLANTKASFHRFDGPLGDPTARPPVKKGVPDPRNATIKGAEARRRRLEIDPMARSVAGREVTKGPKFAPGAHPEHETWPTMDDTDGGEKVIDYLGELRTDESGRLLVFGGHGKSRANHRGGLLVEDNFANYDGWHDDVADGPVTATLHFRDGTAVQVGGWDERACLERKPSRHAGGAWVVVGPPKFAPHFNAVVSLYDLMADIAVRHLALDDPRGHREMGSRLWRLAQLRDPAYRPSYTYDVQPILARALLSRFVFGEAATKHYSLAPEVWTLLGDPTELPDARTFVFRYLRAPFGVDAPEGAIASMPMLFGDQYQGVDFDGDEAPDGAFMAVTETQYEILRRWSSGHFVADWTDAPAAAEEAVTPDGLDCAALQAAVGGPLFPGIEVSWLIRDPSIYAEPFRIKHDETIRAGHFTRQMAVPWQADFFDCASETVTYNASSDPSLQSTDIMTWWPTHRPNDVIARGAADRVPWARTSNGKAIETKQKFLAQWKKLGFVVDTSGDRREFTEVDREEE